MNIHNTALVDEETKIHPSVKIGAYSIIEKGVIIDEGTEIAPYTHIMGNTRIGKNNKIYTGAVIGYDPQDTSFNPEKNVGIIIGCNNIIREHVTIHLSTKDNSNTLIGNDCFLMVGSHIAHDCVINDNVIIVNNAQLAGHTIVEKNAFISGNVGIHQKCRIGAYAMVGANEKIAQDVVPFILIDDFPAKPVGINRVGLRRAGFSPAERKNINRAYHILFREKLSTPKALEVLEEEFPDEPNIRYMINYIRTSIKSGRGIIKYK